MNWYLATIVYRFISGNGLHTPQFNEQLRIIEADDRLHAFYKARQIGEQETIKITSNGLLIEWQFVDVTALQSLGKCTDGAEVWSSIFEDVNAAQYIHQTHQKANALLQEGIHEFNTLIQTI
jgi:hypothetical protein